VEDASMSSMEPEGRDSERAAAAMVAERLAARGMRLDGRESSTELVQLLEAVESFERAVQLDGGNLMVDEGDHAQPREPDDARFVLPVRQGSESAAEFASRISIASSELRSARR
jgi:hypothetical protein